MRSESGYQILEAEDLIKSVTLADINRALSQEQSQNGFLVDTRPTVVNSKSSGYESNIMFYSVGRMNRQKDVESILSSYFVQEDVTLNYTGNGREHRYYNLVNL